MDMPPVWEMYNLPAPVGEMSVAAPDESGVGQSASQPNTQKANKGLIGKSFDSALSSDTGGMLGNSGSKVNLAGGNGSIANSFTAPLQSIGTSVGQTVGSMFGSMGQNVNDFLKGNKTPNYEFNQDN